MPSAFHFYTSFWNTAPLWSRTATRQDDRLVRVLKEASPGQARTAGRPATCLAFPKIPSEKQRWGLNGQRERKSAPRTSEFGRGWLKQNEHCSPAGVPSTCQKWMGVRHARKGDGVPSAAQAYPSPDSFSSRPFRGVFNSWAVPQELRACTTVFLVSLERCNETQAALQSPRVQRNPVSPAVPGGCGDAGGELLGAARSRGTATPTRDSRRPSYLGFRGGPRRLGGQRQAYLGHLWLLAHL